MPGKKKKKTASTDLSALLKDRLAFYATLFVLAIFVVHPLAIGPDTYYNITEVKLWTFATIVLVTLALLAGAYAYKLMQGYVPRIALKERLRGVRPYEWALLAYWLVIFLSAITSHNPQYAFYGVTGRNEGFWMQSAYITAFFIAGRLYRPKVGHLAILCATASLIALYAVCQYYGYDFIPLYPGADTNPGMKGSAVWLLSTMSNLNMSSTYYCLILCLCAALFARLDSPRLRLAFLPMGWIAFYGMLIANTDSGYVGLVVALAVGFPFVAKDKKSASRLLFLLSGCALLAWVFGQAYRAAFEAEPQMAAILAYMPYLAAALAAVSAILYWAPIPAAPQRLWRGAWLCLMAVVLIVGLLSLETLGEITGHPIFHQAREVLRGNLEDDFGSARGFVWKKAMAMVPEHPILGYGPDNFAVTFYERYYEESMEVNHVWFDKVHNEYLQVLVDTGALGLSAILAFYGCLFWAARKHLHNPAVTALAVALVCFMAQAFFNFSTPFAHPVAWTLWGVLAACSVDNIRIDRIQWEHKK